MPGVRESTRRPKGDFGDELGERFKRIYGLKRKPRNPEDFFRLLKFESARNPGTQRFLGLVRSGKAVIGRCKSPTKDWILVGEEKVHTLCSYDILMTALLRGDAEIGSACPHCGKLMSVRIKGGQLSGFKPHGMVFLWGAGPDGAPGNPMCDHLHLFPGKKHEEAWVESKPGKEMGFVLELSDAIRRLGDRF